MPKPRSRVGDRALGAVPRTCIAAYSTIAAEIAVDRAGGFPGGVKTLMFRRC